MTVHLGYVTPDFHALIDGDLYLFEESWSQDSVRCREAKIPDDVVYRPKTRIALDLSRRSPDDGVPLRWITADEFYGRSKEFRDTVADWGLEYVVEVPSNLCGSTRKPRVEPAGTLLPSGSRSGAARLATGEKPARPVSKLWNRGGPSWQTYRVKDTQKGPEVWHVPETLFYPRDGGLPGRQGRLIIAKHALSGQVKYFLSAAGPDVPLKILLYVAFSPSEIERLFENGKGEVGFDHFEVRNYKSLMRHPVLTNLSLYFLCDQRQRLRKKTRGGHPPRSRWRSRLNWIRECRPGSALVAWRRSRPTRSSIGNDVTKRPRVTTRSEGAETYARQASIYGERAGVPSGSSAVVLVFHSRPPCVIG